MSFDFKKFYTEQIEFYTRQNGFCRRQIEYYSREIKRSRESDKALKEYALSERPEDPWTQKIYGGKYVSSETRKYINTRARCYREIKRNNGRIEKYTKELKKYGREEQ